MATKLEKMVEASQKRIAKYNKGIERYSSILQKNLDKFGLSEEDIIPHPLGGYTLRDNFRNWDALDAIEELYDYIEGVNEMWTNYDSWVEEDEE